MRCVRPHITALDAKLGIISDTAKQFGRKMQKAPRSMPEMRRCCGALID